MIATAAKNEDAEKSTKNLQKTNNKITEKRYGLVPQYKDIQIFLRFSKLHNVF